MKIIKVESCNICKHNNLPFHHNRGWSWFCKHSRWGMAWGKDGREMSGDIGLIHPDCPLEDAPACAAGPWHSLNREVPSPNIDIVVRRLKDEMFWAEITPPEEADHA